MQCTFYYNQSDPIAVNKSISRIGSSVANFLYKDDTDLVNPTFKVNAIQNRNINNTNYVYIHELNRYYFIDDITYKQDYMVLKCSVDVLMSFKKEIKSMYCIVSRQEQNYNLYLTDEKMRTEAQGRILTYPFQYGFGTSLNGGTVKNCSYIFAINGGGDST